MATTVEQPTSTGDVQRAKRERSSTMVAQPTSSGDVQRAKRERSSTKVSGPVVARTASSGGYSDETGGAKRRRINTTAP